MEGRERGREGREKGEGGREGVESSRGGVAAGMGLRTHTQHPCVERLQPDGDQILMLKLLAASGDEEVLFFEFFCLL